MLVSTSPDEQFPPAKRRPAWRWPFGLSILLHAVLAALLIVGALAFHSSPNKAKLLGGRELPPIHAYFVKHIGHYQNRSSSAPRGEQELEQQVLEQRARTGIARAQLKQAKLQARVQALRRQILQYGRQATMLSRTIRTSKSHGNVEKMLQSVALQGFDHHKGALGSGENCFEKIAQNAFGYVLQSRYALKKLNEEPAKERKIEKKIAKWHTAILLKVLQNVTDPEFVPLPGDLDCAIRVSQQRSGQVTGIKVLKCNANEYVRQVLVDAFLQSSPLPSPSDPKIFKSTSVYHVLGSYALCL